MVVHSIFWAVLKAILASNPACRIARPNHPSPAMKHLVIGFVLADNQITPTIVPPIVIDMVDLSAGGQGMAKCFLSHLHMFRYMPPVPIPRHG